MRKPHPLREQGWEMIKAGFKNDLVASILGVKPATVKTWRHRLGAKERGAIIPRRYVPTTEAVEASQRTMGTLYSWTSRGRVPHYSIGGNLYVCLDAVLSVSSAAPRRGGRKEPRPIPEDGYVTITDAARLVNRSRSTVSKWAREDLVTTVRRHGRRMVLLTSALEQAGKRAKHGAEPPPPSVSVELVPLKMGEETYQGWRIDGVELMAVGLLARILEYRHAASLSDQIRSEWADEFIEGEHFIMVEGLALEALKSELTGSDPVSPPNRTPRVKALTRAGVALVILKTRKPLGVALRRAIADSHFMSELLDGNPEPFEQAKTGQLDTQELATVISTAVVAGIASVLKDLIPQRTEPRHPAGWNPDTSCIHSARSILSKLRREYPYSGLRNEAQVHELARRLKLRGPDGQGRPGYSRHIELPAGYSPLAYSTLALEMMRDFIHRQGVLF